MMYLPSKKIRAYMDEVDKWLVFDIELGCYVFKDQTPDDIKRKYKIIQQDRAENMMVS